MYSIVEYIEDLVAEGYTRGSAVMLARKEADKRKASKTASKKKRALARESEPDSHKYAHHAYATCSIPRDF